MFHDRNAKDTATAAAFRPAHHRGHARPAAEDTDGQGQDGHVRGRETRVRTTPSDTPPTAKAAATTSQVQRQPDRITNFDPCTKRIGTINYYYNNIYRVYYKL